MGSPIESVPGNVKASDGRSHGGLGFLQLFEDRRPRVALEAVRALRNVPDVDVALQRLSATDRARLQQSMDRSGAGNSASSGSHSDDGSGRVASAGSSTGSQQKTERMHGNPLFSHRDVGGVGVRQSSEVP